MEKQYRSIYQPVNPTSLNKNQKTYKAPRVIDLIKRSFANCLGDYQKRTGTFKDVAAKISVSEETLKEMISAPEEFSIHFYIQFMKKIEDDLIKNHLESWSKKDYKIPT